MQCFSQVTQEISKGVIITLLYRSYGFSDKSSKKQRIQFLEETVHLFLYDVLCAFEQLCLKKE